MTIYLCLLIIALIAVGALAHNELSQPAQKELIPIPIPIHDARTERKRLSSRG